MDFTSRQDKTNKKDQE